MFAIYIWNIYDAVKITDKTNTVNGFSKSLTSDKLSEYGWGGKVGLIIFRIIVILVAIILLPITLPIRALRWIIGKIYRCPHCGRDGGIQKIDTVCTGRSNSYYKTIGTGEYKKTHLFEKQELLVTYRCKYCNYEYQERKKKEVQLD